MWSTFISSSLILNYFLDKYRDKKTSLTIDTQMQSQNAVINSSLEQFKSEVISKVTL